MDLKMKTLNSVIRGTSMKEIERFAGMTMVKDLLLVAGVAGMLCSCSAAREVSGDADGYVPDQQINVGYGSVDKDKLTYSVSQLEVDEKEISHYSNIWDYMRSRVPGVEIGESIAGSTPDIVIRGKNSINSPTQPLIMLDGVETSDISGLNPNDVASVSVLKDASASIYGSRGGNGVILITTKSAKMAAEREAAFQREAREAARAAKAARKAARQEAKASKGK